MQRCLAYIDQLKRSDLSQLIRGISMLEENQIVRTLGGNLKIARTKKGMSIKELAEAIDVTPPYRIENNLINNIGIITFSKVCYELDLSDTQVLNIIQSFR